MLLLTWNVAGRVRRRAEQAAAVLATGADLIALQEVTPTNAGAWVADLEGAGYAVLTTGEGPRPEGRRRLGVLLAARGGLEPGPDVADVPWPERLLAARMGDVVLYNLHSPISPAPDLAKVRTHEALHAHLTAGQDPRVLCGDLNTPRRELADGTIWTFARTSRGALRPERGERWDQAELALLSRLGWTDAFRARHGYGRREVSWAWPSGGGYRLDHVLVTPGVGVGGCEYAHAWREARLSDHSGLLAELEIEGR